METAPEYERERNVRPISEKQLSFVQSLIAKAGIAKRESDAFTATLMTSKQVSDAIDQIKAGGKPWVVAKEEAAPVDYDALYAADPGRPQKELWGVLWPLLKSLEFDPNTPEFGEMVRIQCGERSTARMPMHAQNELIEELRYMQWRRDNKVTIYPDDPSQGHGGLKEVIRPLMDAMTFPEPGEAKKEPVVEEVFTDDGELWEELRDKAEEVGVSASLLKLQIMRTYKLPHIAKLTEAVLTRYKNALADEKVRAALNAQLLKLMEP